MFKFKTDPVDKAFEAMLRGRSYDLTKLTQPQILTLFDRLEAHYTARLQDVEAMAKRTSELRDQGQRGLEFVREARLMVIKADAIQ